MKQTPVEVLDVVALLEDKPVDGLSAGQVGTVVEVLAHGVFEVKFLNGAGPTAAVTKLPREQLLVLDHRPAVTACGIFDRKLASHRLRT